MALMLLAMGRAPAAESLHGTVLDILPAKHQVIVRHDAFGGMPSMTMAFSVPSDAEFRKLQRGNGIDASVDIKTEPWTLHNVRVVGIQATTGQNLFRTSKRLQLGDTIPDTPFVTQNGKPFTFAAARGHYAVVAFIYTRCRDARMCPLISAKFAQLQSKASAATQLYEVTLDPDYDRPAILQKYAQTFGFHRVTLLTGDPNQVLDFAAMFGLSAFADPQVGIIHNENTVVLDPAGKIIESVTENSWTPDEVASVIADHEKLPSNWFQRLNFALSKAAVAVCGNGVAGSSGVLDLVVFLIIMVGGGWLFFRFARAIANGST